MGTGSWKSTGYPGIWFREHQTRFAGKERFKDRYYYICYRKAGRVRWEAIGWQSQGATLEKALMTLANVKMALREGRELKSLKERRLEYAESVRAEENIPTITEYWEEKYRPMIRSGYSEGSFKRSESIFSNWLLKFFGRIRVTDITADRWDELRNSLSESRLAPRTREYIAGELRRLLKDAKERGYRVRPVPSARKTGMGGPFDNRRERVIKPEEARAIMEYLEKRDAFAGRITKSAFLTGCRFSECARLGWEHIREDHILITRTKNKTVRKLAITELLLELLENTPGKADAGIVFKNPRNLSYLQSPKSFAKAAEYLELNTERSRLDRITFHSIRHTVATKLAGKLDIGSLMDFMGWKRIEMTAHYVHGNYDAIRRAASDLARLFSGLPAD